MSTIALVSCYTEDWRFRGNVQRFVDELNRFCEKVVVLINRQPTQHISADIIVVPNEWYDFGMFYRYIMWNQDIINQYNDLLLTNDSICLVRPLDNLFSWIATQGKNYLSASEALMTTNKELEPVVFRESRFLYIKKPIKEEVVQYFKDKGLYPDKFKVVDIYEVWLSKKYKDDSASYITIEQLLKRWCYFHDLEDYEKSGDQFSTGFVWRKEAIEEWMPFVKTTFERYWLRQQYKDYINYFSNILYQKNVQQLWDNT